MTLEEIGKTAEALVGKTYVEEFLKEVYPEMTELAVASCPNEKQCLRDATELIRELRSEAKTLRGRFQQIQKAYRSQMTKRMQGRAMMVFGNMVAQLIQKAKKEEDCENKSAKSDST